ncbi:hypothetical protein [Bradyrhizobium sp. C9]|uniref:hypothetical protein n=1 Tax=Bradyrhizobium sp. C9 TaxID=142585 RepID=UPI000BE7C57B|nr:hypothetical protein [Bradyrhizobium sp. C9]PDT77221.1 hypothetical protein CO675_11835 [Bradyrhizobium sp. C9]
MKNKPFLYEMKSTVKMVESNEQGTVIGRAEFESHCNSYQVRYRAGDGRQVEAWFDEPAIEAA